VRNYTNTLNRVLTIKIPEEIRRLIREFSSVSGGKKTVDLKDVAILLKMQNA